MIHLAQSTLFTSIFSSNEERNVSEPWNYYCNETAISFVVKMYRRDAVSRGNFSYSWEREGKVSLDFSRHLCVTTRMARSLQNQRPSRRFSDSETTTIRKQTRFQPCDDSKDKNIKFGKRQSAEGKLPRKQVYNVDQTFQRKFGNTGEMQTTNTLASSSYRANREAVAVNSLGYQVDDEVKSFCDSVSSIACSSFARHDVDKQKPWNKNDRKFPDKIAKVQAIEKWLQSLPEPGS